MKKLIATGIPLGKAIAMGLHGKMYGTGGGKSMADPEGRKEPGDSAREDLAEPAMIPVMGHMRRAPMASKPTPKPAKGGRKGKART